MAQIAETWRAAGFAVQAEDDVERLVWEKLICNVCFSGTCTVLECTIGEVLDDPPAWSVASACAREAYEVAVASGVALGFDDPLEHTAAFGERIRDARPSMLLDRLAGRPSEIDGNQRRHSSARGRPRARCAGERDHHRAREGRRAAP